MKNTNSLTKPMVVSKELEKIIGKKKCSREQTLKRVWKYIKNNELQVENNKRNILPDVSLSKILGKKPIYFTKIIGKVYKHLSEEPIKNVKKEKK